ncbi:hypothetical protein EK21DRAFT_81324, partial [Setomelanomma holmii]
MLPQLIAALLCCLALCSASPAPSTAASSNIDFNALPDGSLGYLPADWLASQGMLLELNKTNAPVPASARSLDPPAATPSAAGRDKENGAVVGTFVSGMLTATSLNIKGNTAAQGLCMSLPTGAGTMAGTVITQEGAKNIYGENSTALDFEQGVVPGSFFGSIVGHGTGTALSRGLCKHVLSDFGKMWKGIHPDAMPKTYKTFHRALTEILGSHMRSIGVDSARAAKFADQMTETRRLMDRLKPDDSLEFLDREILRVSSDLVSDIARLQPQVQGSSDSCSIFTRQFEKLNDLAKNVPKAKQIAEKLEQPVEGLHDGVKKAADLAKKGFPAEAKDALKKADNMGKDAFKALSNLNPFPGSSNSKPKVTETATQTVTEHVTSTHHETRTHTETAT